MNGDRLDQYRSHVTDGAFLANLDRMDDMLREVMNLNVRWNEDNDMKQFLGSLEENITVVRIKTSLMIQKQLVAEGIIPEEEWKEMTIMFCLASPKYVNVVLDMEDRLGLEHSMYLDDMIRDLLKAEDRNIDKMHIGISDDDTLNVEVVDDPEPEED